MKKKKLWSKATFLALQFSNLAFFPFLLKQGKKCSLHTLKQQQQQQINLGALTMTHCGPVNGWTPPVLGEKNEVVRLLQLWVLALAAALQESQHAVRHFVDQLSKCLHWSSTLFLLIYSEKMCQAPPWPDLACTDRKCDAYYWKKKDE